MQRKAWIFPWEEAAAVSGRRPLSGAFGAINGATLVYSAWKMTTGSERLIVKHLKKLHDTQGGICKNQRTMYSSTHRFITKNYILKRCKDGILPFQWAYLLKNVFYFPDLLQDYPAHWLHRLFLPLSPWTLNYEGFRDFLVAFACSRIGLRIEIQYLGGIDWISTIPSSIKKYLLIQ